MRSRSIGVRAFRNCVRRDSVACCDDCCGEGGFFVGEDCAQVEDEAIVFDARDYWRAGGGFAKAGFEGGWGELRR